MESITLEPIGYVRSDVARRKDLAWGSDVSDIVLCEQYAAGLTGLEDFSHAIIVFYLDQANYVAERHLMRHPQNRNDMPCVGIFSQRGKDRPNRIGTTAVEIVSVKEGELRVRGRCDRRHPRPRYQALLPRLRQAGCHRPRLGRPPHGALLLSVWDRQSLRACVGMGHPGPPTALYGVPCAHRRCAGVV